MNTLTATRKKAFDNEAVSRIAEMSTQQSTINYIVIDPENNPVGTVYTRKVGFYGRECYVTSSYMVGVENTQYDVFYHRGLDYDPQIAIDFAVYLSKYLRGYRLIIADNSHYLLK
jgi:hypothetical protein